MPDLRSGTPPPERALGPILVSFAVLAVAYDAAASAVVLVTGWPYGTLALGGLVLQALAGLAAGRRAGFLWAMVAGAATALAEATLGFGAAWLIGPGRLHLPATAGYLAAVVRAVLGGVALGGVGGALTLGWSPSATDAAPWSARAWLRALRVDGFLARELLMRGVWLWAGLRVLFSLAMGAGFVATAGSGGAPFGVAVVTPQVVVVELLVLLALADLARRRELVLFADLGLGPVRAAVLYVAPGALLEAALLLVPR